MYGQDFESNVRIGPTPYIKETDRDLIGTRNSIDSKQGLPWVKNIANATAG